MICGSAKSWAAIFQKSQPRFSHAMQFSRNKCIDLMQIHVAPRRHFGSNYRVLGVDQIGPPRAIVMQVFSAPPASWLTGASPKAMICKISVKYRNACVVCMGRGVLLLGGHGGAIRAALCGLMSSIAHTERRDGSFGCRTFHDLISRVCPPSM